jgi:predicted DNA-binding protein
MSTIVIDIPSETYRRLEAQSRKAGKSPEMLTRELLETALQAYEEVQPQTVREVLQNLGRVHPLSENLRRKIIPGVTLTEVRTALTQAAGPSLTEIILAQRGPKL